MFQPLIALVNNLGRSSRLIVYPPFRVDESLNTRIAKLGENTIYQNREVGIKKYRTKDSLFGLKINPVINSS